MIYTKTEHKKLGEILIEEGLLTGAQLEEALALQKTTGKRLGRILIELGFVKEEDLLHVLSRQMSIPHVWLRRGLIDPKIVHIIPAETARLYKVMPMFKVRNSLIVATSDPQAIYVFDKLEEITNLQIQPVLTRSEDIEKAIEEYYGGGTPDLTGYVSEYEKGAIEVINLSRAYDSQAIEKAAEGSPIINLVNSIILKAIKDRASDIHIEPGQKKLRIRYRIDGILYEVMTQRIELLPAIVSRLKVMANLDIAERRLPQDGRIQVMVEGRSVDIRFSSMPGILGEKVVLRILDKRNAIFDLNQLGLSEDVLKRFKNILKTPYGLILVTGPTGSGKTTTLYAAINYLNSIEKNIITIEDPVEYQIDIVNQNQVKESIGLTFAEILRHALRQDPDIIMVGEIRDKETAEIAIQASLTGHLVLSTLHTNDSPSAITRLMDMGIEPYLIASALTGVIAQRLVRTICKNCKTLFFPPTAILERYGWTEEHNLQLAKGKGCPECYDSGYRGRIGLFELLEVDEELRTLILTNPSLDAIKAYLKNKGFTTMEMDGLNKVKSQITTLEEVSRAVSINI